MKFFYRLFFSLILVVFSIYALAYFMPAPPIGLEHSLEMYDSEGNLFYASANNHYGTYTPLSQVNPNFTNAIISIEDKNFYHHSGFDILGIIRALITNISKGNLSQGASTITQQYVKNLFLTNEKTWERKIKEAWLTIRVEVHYSKDEILEGYINALYYGDGIYGIENASNYYFGHDAENLSILEGSMLAGMINGPELYSPYRNYPLTKERQQLVLKAMYKNKYISKETYQQLKNKDTTLKTQQDHSDISTLGYFRQVVYNELNNLGYDSFEGHLQVYTTLNLELQNEITNAIQSNNSSDLQTAAVILEPNSGAISVLIGGNNYYQTQYNRATEAKRQMASTIKPILYYEALTNGFHPLSKFISEKTTFHLENNQTYCPTNFNDKYPNKDITMVEAVATSDNIYAVKTHLFLGTSLLASRLERFNITSVEANPSLALGTKEISPLDLCSIYNCIASKGIYYEPYSIKSIKSNGKVTYQKKVTGTKKLDETYCLILSQLLTAPFQPQLKGTMSSYQVKSTFAAKTGTSDWDSWLIAYNPNLTLTFWTGYDNNDYLEYLNQHQLRKIFYAVFSDKIYSWYSPNKEIMEISIDLSTCKISQNGTPFWFYTSNKKLRN